MSNKLKLAANLSMMFQEIPKLSERYQAAKDAGFRYVECTFPYDEPAEVLKEAKEKAGVEHVLLNSWPGDLSQNQLGLATLSSKEKEFREKLELTIEYAKALSCERVHIMAGKYPKTLDQATEETYLNNIEYAAGRLQKENILGLIEAVNSKISVPNYFLDDPSKAFEYVKKINHPNLKMQCDVFHVQIMNGNLTSNLKKWFPVIGHIQIAQAPDRGEPNSAGEINYAYIFKLLQDLQYDGYIGLEYKPTGLTTEGLSWIEQFGLQL